eukprot:CAMPEP_0178942258 /NCGR_PEP_ID=MMETSP0789-20121207/1892_1 /TAXON_ID=3005 /ORGANISM="Rhizosolenia setigera, Strain CCMP 1694" /LENGTH=292 /DNA_ID=CAMNT_0020621643 /DNA_START=15 /DNA_END=893 /DNA_ORIENTATION=-
MPSSYSTRPGVTAGIKLIKSLEEEENTNEKEKSLKIWETIESQYDEMILEKGGTKLKELDNYCNNLSNKLSLKQQQNITKENLLKIIEWKFTKGKPRNALWGRLRSNTDQAVKEASQESFSKVIAVNNDDVEDCVISNAIESMCVLNGVGPATASAILSLYSSKNFAFMDDEVIESVLYNKKRAYTLKIYLEMNEKCMQIADVLNNINESDEWNARRVGRAIWTACLLSASGRLDMNDLNSIEKEKEKSKDSDEGGLVAAKPNKKRLMKEEAQIEGSSRRVTRKRRNITYPK